MALVKRKKQKWERPVIAGNFQAVLVDNETIVIENSFVDATDIDGLDVSESFLDQSTISVDDFLLKIRTLDGENGGVYSIHFRAETSTGNRWETDMEISVNEIGTEEV